MEAEITSKARYRPWWVQDNWINSLEMADRNPSLIRASASIGTNITSANLRTPMYGALRSAPEHLHAIKPLQSAPYREESHPGFADIASFSFIWLLECLRDYNKSDSPRSANENVDHE